MHKRNPFSDETAIAPVIGVVLLVAITVLLAATAATFFFSLAQDQGKQTTPRAAFEANAKHDVTASNSDVVVIEHTTGDAIEAGHLAVVVRDATASGGSPDGRYQITSLTSMHDDSLVEAGNSIRLGPSTMGLGGADIEFDQAVIKVVYVHSQESTSHVLYTWNGPDAS